MENLIRQAREILDLNRKNGFTIPARTLYPFQWNWDSGFISIGLSHVHLNHAIRELRTLFSGQWANGMLPHILFHSETETTYFPNFDFWQSHVNPGAPLKPKTSGITQPPVAGFVLEHLLNRSPDHADLKAFIRHIFPQLVRSHRFFYTYRDPGKEGLIFIYHPWESGRDNSPLWDTSLDRISIAEGELPKYVRRDTEVAHPEQRPTSQQYDRFVYLLLLGRKHQYDGPGIAAESPFLIQDSMMNAILITSNASLIALGERLGLDTAEVEEWQQQSVPHYQEKLWNADHGTFVPWDLRADCQIPMQELGGYISLFGRLASDDQARKMHGNVIDLHKRGYYLCPSFDVDSPLFDAKRYWRGPVWPQMNWMLYHGLRNYGYRETAEMVKSDLLELVRCLGFYEYFEPQKHVAKQLGRGYGGNHFSWTAACVIDLLHST